MNEYFQVINRMSDTVNKAVELLEQPGLKFPERN